jgi:hypothetical protein
MIRWVQYKKVTAEPVVIRRFALEQGKEAFTAFSSGDTVEILFEM